MIIRLPIDTKSLYLNIKNDNLKGHTATVATPLKQGNSYNYELGKINEINEAKIDLTNRPLLVREFIKNSKSKIIIKDAFVFKKIMVNGMHVDTKGKQFCIFIKEEVDPSKVQCGRLKVHYPKSLKYEDIDLDIDNKKVLGEISQKLFNYAFLVRSFEYDTINKTLNFDILIVGENQIPYSKVFINEKGTGNKFSKIFNESADDYDFEIIPLRQVYGESINPSNYLYYISIMKKKAIEIAHKFIDQGLEIISNNYPYSLFDICYKRDNEIYYIILRYTATNIMYFNMSIMQKLFFQTFNKNTRVFVITEILTKPKLKILTYEDISKMQAQVNSIKYVGGHDNG